MATSSRSRQKSAASSDGATRSQCELSGPFYSIYWVAEGQAVLQPGHYWINIGGIWGRDL